MAAPQTAPRSVASPTEGPARVRPIGPAWRPWPRPPVRRAVSHWERTGDMPGHPAADLLLVERAAIGQYDLGYRAAVGVVILLPDRHNVAAVRPSRSRPRKSKLDSPPPPAVNP